MKKALSILIALLLIGGFVWLVRTPGRPGKLDGFATCVKDSGTLFYGAFWCPHCAAQKALFGSSAHYLPYVECSSADGQSQLPICNEAGVQGYPTWKFPDGTVKSGEVTLAELATATNCPLPE
jgi:hypothetical protein